MCGIVGIVGFANDERDRAREALEQSVSLLHHRGPDARGIWMGDGVALGHTRLSIIDLTECGNQPMRDASGRWTLIYNGEVYNYIELRDQLRDRGYTFRGHSDTEVVLTAFMAWGESALERFNGMWALALWDGSRRELFLARDRAGKKPLYHATLPNGTFAFASEITPLLRLGVKVGVNRQAAFDFLTQGTYGHLGAQTFFDGIEQIPAAHCATIRPRGQLSLRRYWDLPVVRPRDRIPYDESFKRRFRDTFTEAVTLRLRSDVPIGDTLSGGLDSSTIALLVDQITGGAPIHLFTSLYPGSARDETPYFEAVVSRLRNPIVHRVQPDPERWQEDLLDVLRHQEEPFGDTSILAHYSLMRAAREAGVPVILSGQGGDEVLLGYPSMVNAYFGAQLARGNPLVVREALRYASGVGMSPLAALRNVLGAALPLPVRDRIRQRFVRRMAQRVTPDLLSGVSLSRFESDERDMFSSYIRQVFTRFAIPHLTHYDDRNAMAFAVEGRMPFLDTGVVTLMAKASHEALFADGMTKRVLRDAFADLLPSAVLRRRDKVGFHTPLGQWLQAHQSWVGGFMTTDRIVSHGLLKAPHYDRALALLQSGAHDAVLEVWRGFILHLWLDEFGPFSTAASVRAA